jgi:hypothetical protein
MEYGGHLLLAESNLLVDAVRIFTEELMLFEAQYHKSNENIIEWHSTVRNFKCQIT